ncbi:MAG: rod shape-determining protein MreD [Ignavibacteria bacterium]
MVSKILKYVVVLAVFIVLQKSLIWLLAISTYNISPDLVIVILAYISIKEGKITGVTFGFFAGLLIDILGGTFIGLQALSYTLACFVAGFFKREDEKFLKNQYFLLVVFIISLVSNFVFYSIYFQGANIKYLIVLMRYVLTSSAYTLIVSLIYLLLPRRKSTFA